MTLSINRTRLLDLSRVLAGPVCSMILGDLGADVIKVERPGVGDDTRAWGPPFDADGKSAYFLSVNRNKLSIALDLEERADRSILLRLIASADVVLENFLPNSLERRGIDPPQLLRAHEGLIWCTISGFGPSSSRPGYDFVIQAESGWMAVTGEVAGEPMKVGIALADVIAGKDAAIAILGALFAQAKATEALAPESRRIHISLAHSATAALVNVAQNALVSGSEALRYANAHPNLVPYELFKASDRHLVIAVGSDAQWTAACQVLGLHDLAQDPLPAKNSGRLQQRERIASAFAMKIAERTAADWLGKLGAAGVPCGLVRSVREALASVKSDARTGVPPSVPGTIRITPPNLDEHGALIRRFGWGAFEELRS